ncbi:MFS transporter, partial [Streptococcus agalactiae]|nr:MFS transporter [Streptococcus agalactiae]
SNLVRATGLAVLALSPKNFLLLALSAFLTALGDSLMSGTLPSWIANKAALNNEKDQLGEIYSTYSLIASPFNMIVGFIGAHFLANIDLRLPLLTGAAFLAV